MHLPLAITQWTALLAVRLVLILLGFFVVAAAIPYRSLQRSKSDGRPIINLPRWAWLWGNDYDGLLGDKRGWWVDNTPFGWQVNSFSAMWWWAAVRNPVNNLRMVSGVSCPVSECSVSYAGDRTVEDRPGMGGWQFVIAERRTSAWYGFYLVHEWSATRAFVVRVGFKLKPSHAGSSEPPKGMTFKINPWKEI